MDHQPPTPLANKKTNLGWLVALCGATGLAGCIAAILIGFVGLLVLAVIGLVVFAIWVFLTNPYHVTL
jgi:hypothetical protein